MSRRYGSKCISIFTLVSIAAILGGCGTSGPPTPPQETEIVSYVFSPPSPATLKHGESVSVELSFVTGHPGPIRMWAQIEYDGPIDDGTLTYCPSPAIEAKQGVEERCFAVKDAFIGGVPATAHVDTIELSIVDKDQTVELYEELVTVDYTWEP